MPNQRIVIFGAGAGGRRAYRSLRSEGKVIAFVDNDATKQGGRAMNRPIISPTELKELQYDKLFVASMYANQIIYQLCHELEIPRQKIEQVDKAVLNGDQEIPWGCLSVITIVLAILGWVGYHCAF